MKDSQILRLVAARIAESRDNPVFPIKYFQFLSQVTLDNKDYERIQILCYWIDPMLSFRGSPFAWMKLKNHSVKNIDERVWCVIWLLRLARAAEGEGC